MYSKWNKVDLHIHSKFSNNVKNNDYDGTEFTARELLEKLKPDGEFGFIFSITDHNCINESLYNDLLIEINNYENMNFIVGVELDIKDKSIYKDVFHCLCFFENYDISLIKKSIDELFNSCKLSERNQEEMYPNINAVFSTFHNNGIQDVILVPHFNNKSKGIPSKIAIEHLNYLCFNAYEDSNNINNIQKSLSIYLNNGFDNFPFAVFSDSHNLDTYPKDKNGKECIPCYMLSNLNHSFNSIKTAFQEPRLRISFDGVKDMRNPTKQELYLSKVTCDGRDIYLSPYQNTIIGRFGSGKSLLLEEMKNGIASLQSNEKYRDFYKPERVLKIEFKDQLADSIEEAFASNNNIKKYEFIQSEDFYFKNYLSNEEARNLFGRLNIVYSPKENITFDFNDSIVMDFNNFRNCFNKVKKINNLNYEKAFSTQEYFSVVNNDRKVAYEEITSKLTDASRKNTDVISLKINDSVFVFSEDEKLQILKTIKLIDDKTNDLNMIKGENIESKINTLILDYNNKYINNNAKESKDKFVLDLKDFLEKTLKLKEACNEYEQVYNHEIFNELIVEKFEPVEGTEYSISSKYDVDTEYKDSISSIFKQEDRKSTLFESFAYFVFNGKSKIVQNKNVTELQRYLEKFQNSVNDTFVKEKAKYDLISKDGSMLKKSAGEKSSKFIKLIFDLIEKDLQFGKTILLILDQPEDNIDNKNIYSEISMRLKKLKIGYPNFQSIVVTHNANVGIAADSENIIIAKEKFDEDGNKTFVYKNGCIEDKKYIAEVCEILEGGVKAMEQRSIKYGINVIKKVDENGL